MAKILLLAICLFIHITCILSDTSQCQVVCKKSNKVRKNNNIEIFLEYKKGIINLPDRANYVEENRMITLPNGEIIPEVSLRLPSEFTVDPVAANCASKEFLTKIKELRKNIKCSPRPVIVEVLSNDGQVFPNKVLTKQCAGLCNGKKVCSAVKTVNTSFPVQILSNDGGIKCSTILVPEDTKCRCKCSITKKDCTVNQKYDKKLCKCICKNEVERTHCLRKAAKSHQHEWDSKSCSCVCINETPCTTGTFWDKSACRCSKRSDNG